MDGVPMPGEFGLYHFNNGLSGQQIRTRQQIQQLVWWVVGKNKLWGMIEVLAIKYPFAAGVGRDTSGGTDKQHLAVDKSALGLIEGLKKLPPTITADIEKLMTPYFQAWENEAVAPNTYRHGSSIGPGASIMQSAIYALAGVAIDANEDIAIYADMAPEGRLSMVLSLIENTYAIKIKLLQGQYPLINLFDVYLQAGVEGRAGNSIHAMASR